jgi:FtsX-like permease family
MTAHWVVLGAAALTTLVAAAVAAALAVFAGQALPLAVRHDLSVAPGTAVSVSGPVTSGQTGATSQALRTAIGHALGGVPFAFSAASWSDPLSLVPGKAPSRPASTPKSDTPLLQAAVLTGVTSHAILVSGQWPAASVTAGTPIPAALPASAAMLLHVSAGDVLTVRDRADNSVFRFRITGLFAQRQQSGTAAAYWSLNVVPASGSSTLGGFTTYGPLLVSPAALTATGAPLTVSTGTWVAQPDTGEFTDTDLSGISAAVSALQSEFQSSATLGGMQVSTGLPSVLAGTASNLSVARSLLVINALQLVVLAVAALLAVARLLAAQREDETALLVARGATRRQLLRLTADEVIPLCAVTAVVGAVIGIRLAAVLASAGPLHAAGIRLPGPALLLGGGGTGSAAGTWLDALLAAIAVAVIAILAMLGPVLGAGPSIGAARARRGRQAAIAGATRAGADLALIVLAVLAGWQLRRYSAATNGPNSAVDPVLALAPALALAGGTVVTLRLLPAAARAGDRLAARGRRLTASLAGWQVSRQPLRQGGAALLLVMAVATGTLALAQHESWGRSASDQAAFTAGANVRVDTPLPISPGKTATVTSAAGVQHAMAVSVQSETLPAPLLAIDAAQAPQVATIRSDQSALPAASLFGEITPKTQPGSPLPGHPAAIRLTAALTPAASVAQLAPVSVTVTVADATGDMYQLDAGTLPADGRSHVLTATLGGTHASFPLRLVQVSLSYTLPLGPTPECTLTVTGFQFTGWSASVSSPDLQSLQDTSTTVGASALPSGGTWRSAGGTATYTFSPGYGHTAANPGIIPPGPAEPAFGQVTLNAPAANPATLPAIATKAFLDANNTSVGSIVQATVGGTQIPLTIVAEVTSFPTIAGNGEGLVVDLPAIQEWLVSRNAPPLGVTEWWLATDGGQTPAGLRAALPPGSSITSAAQTAAALTGNPLSAAPQQALLALAIAAALLAITGFWVSIAANVRQRRAENALLAALGVSQRSAAIQLCLEKLMLSVPSAALGVVLGTVVARLLVPAVTLTAAAQQPVPPPVTLFDLSQTIPLAAATALVPALATALIMIRRPDPAAELRAAEA